MKFLETVADPKTSLEFNKVKGSVPIRNDVDVASLPAYQRQASESLWSDKILLSITHGELMPPVFSKPFYDAVATFVQSKHRRRSSIPCRIQSRCPLPGDDILETESGWNAQ